MRAGTAGCRRTAQMRSTPPSEAPDSPRHASHHRDASTAYELERYQRTYVIGNFVDAAYDPASMDLFTNAVAAEFA